MNTEFITVNPDNIIDDSQKLKFKGYHLMQQLKITLPEDQEISSITSIYPCAFIYENEMHDLFGVQIKMINIDFEGKLYRTAIETPFK